MTKNFTYIFTCLILSVLTQSVHAQTTYFGLGGAIDYNSYTGIDDFGIVDYKGSAGYRAGFVIQYNLNSKVSFKGKLNYATKSFKEVIDFSKIPNDPLIGESKVESQYINRFIELPLDVTFKLNKNERLDIVSTFGVINSFQIGREYKNSIASNDSKVYHDYLFGLKTGLGFLFKLDGIGIYLEPQVGFYLNQVHTRFPDRNPLHFGLEVQVLKIK
jgi:hypothetical protein